MVGVGPLRRLGMLHQLGDGFGILGLARLLEVGGKGLCCDEPLPNRQVEDAGIGHGQGNVRLDVLEMGGPALLAARGVLGECQDRGGFQQRLQRPQVLHPDSFGKHVAERGLADGGRCVSVGVDGLASLECPCADFRHALGYRDGLEGFAILEDPFADYGHILGYRDGLEGFAILEGAIANFGHALGYRDGLEGFASREDVALDYGHALRYRDRLERFAIIERAGADLGHTLGYRDRLEGFAIIEGAGTDLSHAPGYLDRLE